MRFYRKVDNIIKKVNEITPNQLKQYGFDYLKCIRRKKYLFISSIFDMTFIANMGEVHSSIDGVGYGNKLFKSYAILVIDIDESRYVFHSYTGIPINLDLYNYNTNKNYRIITDSIKENPLIIKSRNYWRINSSTFDTTRPLTKTRSHFYHMDGHIDQEINFDINEYIDKYVVYDYRGYLKSFNNPFNASMHNKESKEDFINMFNCDCVEDKKSLRLGCFTCERNGDCNGHHVRKCSCGKFTYFRKNTCMKCHLTYSRSKKIALLLSRDNYYQLFNSRHGINNQLPTRHYNGSGGGLCLGRGYQTLDRMIDESLNPVRLMLAFKANLAYTDHSATNSYYSKFKNKMTYNQVDKYSEFVQLMRGMFNRVNINPSYHVFTVYCYCHLCMFIKIVLHKKDKKIDPRGTEISKGAIISRDKFIEVYKGYLRRRRKVYQSSYIHDTIKEIVNIKPIDFLTTEQL